MRKFCAERTDGQQIRTVKDYDAEPNAGVKGPGSPPKIVRGNVYVHDKKIARRVLQELYAQQSQYECGCMIGALNRARLFDDQCAVHAQVRVPGNTAEKDIFTRCGCEEISFA